VSGADGDLPSFDAVSEAIAAARRAVAANDFVDLTGLDAAIASLCDSARSAPAREPAASQLKALLTALDALTSDLATQQATLERAEADAVRRQATAAYARPAPGDQP
jgi:hypothetical protein